MDLSEIYLEAKAKSIGEPVIEIPADKVLTDDKGRVFIALDTLVKCIQGQT